jgi:hypothetical protein
MKKFLFANPLQPELCPHLWLAVYLSTHDIGLDNNNALFPGNHTASRIGKALQQLIKSVVEGGGPLSLGDLHNLGLHSFRKV